MADHAVAQCSIEQRDGSIGAMPGTHQSISGSNDVIEDIRCDTDLVLVVREHAGQNDIENRTGLFSVKLIDDDRREAALECRIIVKTLCLTHRRCCDDTQVSSGQRRLEDLCNLVVGRVAVISDDVDLINEEQRVIVWILGKLDDLGDSVLQFTDDACTSDKRSDRQLIDGGVPQLRRNGYFLVSDTPGDLFDDGGLANTCWTNKKRVRLT